MAAARARCCRLQSIQIKLFNKLTKETTLEPAEARPRREPHKYIKSKALYYLS